MSTKRCNNSTEAKDGQSTSRTSQLNSFSSLFHRHIYLTRQSSINNIYIHIVEWQASDSNSPKTLGSRHTGASLFKSGSHSMSIHYRNRNRKLQTSKAPLKSQAQGTSLFTSATYV